MTEEELATYQMQWLRLKGMHREIKMMCLGGSRDRLYAEDMQTIVHALEASMEELRKRIEK